MLKYNQFLSTKKLSSMLIERDMSADDIKKMLVKRISNSNDEAFLDSILYQVKEDLFRDLVKKISAARSNALDADEDYIVNTVRTMSGNTIDKIKFLKGCIKGDYLDFGKLVSDASKGKISIMDRITDPMAKEFFQKTAIKNSRFTLGDSKAVGPGEGAIIVIANGVGKGAAGDLSYKGRDIEVKAHSARWGSARQALNKPQDFNKHVWDYLKSKYRGKSLPKEWPITVGSSNYTVATLTREIPAMMQEYNIKQNDMNAAWASAFGKVYPGASGSLKLFTGDLIGRDGSGFAACTAAVIAEYYKKADGWEMILQLDHTSKSKPFTCVAFKDYKGAYKLVKDKVIWPGIWAPGGTDKRSADSPTYGISRK